MTDLSESAKYGEPFDIEKWADDLEKAAYEEGQLDERKWWAERFLKMHRSDPEGRTAYLEAKRRADDILERS